MTNLVVTGRGIRTNPISILIGTVVVLAIVVGLTGCGSEKYSSSSPLMGEMGNRLPSTRVDSKISSADRLPFESWTSGFTLTGVVVRNQMILRGDEYFEAGNKREAYELYNRALLEKLSDGDKEAVMLRIAALALSADKPEQSLATLSKYFILRKQSEERVEGRFSLLFGYAYGRRGEYDQSLAWFTKAHNEPSPSASVVGPAEYGVRALLRSVTDGVLDSFESKWRNEPFIYSLIGQERRRRASPGYLPAKQLGAFWIMQAPSKEEATVASLVGGGMGTKLRVGVILPLSGQHASFGNAVKNGIELALDAQKTSSLSMQQDSAGSPVSTTNSSAAIEVVYKDDKGDLVEASSVARELMLVQKVSIVLGPLMGDSASAVADIARKENVPVLLLNKSGTVTTSLGVFRMGLTIENQMESLVDSLVKNQAFSRYGLVFPNDAVGEDYAQAFRTALLNRGVSLAYETTYAKSNPDALVAIAAEVDGKDLDAVFLADNIRAAARFYSAISPSARQRITPLGSALWDSLNELKQSSTVLNGAIFVSPFFTGDLRETVQQFVEGYRSKYGSTPNFFAAQGFDAISLMVELGKRTSLEAGAISETFGALPLVEGVSGVMSVRGDGEVSRTLPVVRFQNGGIASLAVEQNIQKAEQNAGAEDPLVQPNLVHEAPYVPADPSRSGSLLKELVERK